MEFSGYPKVFNFAQFLLASAACRIHGIPLRNVLVSEWEIEPIRYFHTLYKPQKPCTLRPALMALTMQAVGS